MKATRGERVFRILNGVFFILIGATMLFPFLNALAKSFSSNTAILRGEVTIFPVNFHIYSYREVISNFLFIRSLLNTVYITVVGTVITLFVVTLVAYALSKKYLPGRTVLFFVFFFTMIFNGGLIPTFLTIRMLGLYDKLWSVILINAMNVYFMILIRAFMMQLPESVEESAIVDGANHLQVLSWIVIPMSTPVLATITLFSAVRLWNTFMHAIIFLQSQDKYPLQVYVRLLVFDQGALGSEQAEVRRFLEPGEEGYFGTETLKMAVLMLTTVPIVMVYPFLQRYFIKGIKLGAVKG